MINFLFFQAEDGIRYSSVTGVQTCALPILKHTVEGAFQAGDRVLHRMLHPVILGLFPHHEGPQLRSEERRVGKECRCRWWRGTVKKYRLVVRQGTVQLR